MGFSGASSWEHFSAMTPSEPRSPGVSTPPSHRTGSLRPGWIRHWAFVGALSGQLSFVFRNIRQPQTVPGTLGSFKCYGEPGLWLVQTPTSSDAPCFLAISPICQTNWHSIMPALGQLEGECAITWLKALPSSCLLYAFVGPKQSPQSR